MQKTAQQTQSLKAMIDTLLILTLAFHAVLVLAFVLLAHQTKTNLNCTALLKAVLFFFIMQLQDSEIIESLNIKDYKIIQSKNLYRFTSDAVLLSHFAAKSAKNIVDLCSGSGIVSIHYQALNECVERAVQCEIQGELAEMAGRSIELNNLQDKFTVLNIPLQELKLEKCFDLVLCNPPYEKKSGSMLPKNAHLAICKTEQTVTLDDIIRASAKLLVRGGTLAMCHKAERLSEIIVTLEKYKLSLSRLQFVYGAAENAYLVLVEATYGKKCALKVMPSITNNFKDFSGK